MPNSDDEFATGRGDNMRSTLKRSRGSASPTESSNTQSSKRNRAVDTPNFQPGIALEEFTVAWVCALPLEMAAAKGMLDQSYPDLRQQDPADHNSYILGQIQGHNVAIACLPAGVYGTTTAATVAKDLLRTFKSIRFGLMVGIGGGAPSQTHDIRLGDVVVSQPSGTGGGVIQYDRGRTLQGGEFQRTGSLNMPPQLLLTALARLQAEHYSRDSLVPQFVSDLVAKSPKRMKRKFSYQGTANDCLFEPEYDHTNQESANLPSSAIPGCSQCDPAQKVRRDARDDTDPVIHYGNIASGNQVIKHGKTRDRLSKELGTLCFEMEAAGLQDFPCLVIRGICDYSDSHKNKMWQEYAAATAAAFAKELLSVTPPDRVRQEQPIPQLLSVAKQQLQVTTQHLDVASEHLIEHQRTNQILEDRPIELPIVHEARYDSADVRDSPRCEIGTRTRIMQRITQWAEDGSPETFFWLVGPAGTGKSTIARTVADLFSKDNRLVGGYFFKRGEQGRNDTTRLFPTLAIQLAEMMPYFKGCLQRSLDGLEKDAVEQRSLEVQFDQLLWKPLGALPPAYTNKDSKVIIIDALDECERPEHYSRLIAKLSGLCDITTVRLRVLVISRSSPRIRDAFEPLVISRAVRSLELHREFSEDTKVDIHTFLKARFADIKNKCRVQQNPWPVTEDLDRLVQLATSPEPLFIYAATLCRFIYDEKRLMNPKTQLKLWLKQCEGSKPQLHQTYDPVLRQAFYGTEEGESACQLQFLGAIILLATPLAAVSLASLLRIDMDDVNWWLPELHAVLDIPVEPENPIRLLHKSFSDFLLYPDVSTAKLYRVDALQTHAALAWGCFQCMESGLKRDICNVQKLGTPIDEIDGQVIDKHIPSELKYACLHWNYHLQRSRRPMINEVFTFLRGYFLHWLEALSLLGKLSDGVNVIAALPDTVSEQVPLRQRLELIDFLKDAAAVLKDFGSIIARAPLQIYCALLYFSPTASQVRQTFWHQRLPSYGSIQGTKLEWDPYRQILDGHSKRVLAVTFSPDGQTVLSTSVDQTMRLWDVSTGLIKQTIPVTGDSRDTAVAFTANGRLVVRALFNAIQLWDTTEGILQDEQTLDVHTDSVRAVACSVGGEFVVSASRDWMRTVQLWDTQRGASLQTLAVDEDSKFGFDYSLDTSDDCYSGDSSDNSNENITDADGEDITDGNNEDMSNLDDKYTEFRTDSWNVVISHDHQVVALSPNVERVWVWDTTTGSLKHVLGHHEDFIEAIAISPDSQTIASCWDRTLQLWDATTGEIRQSLSDKERRFCSVAFSPDSQIVASGVGTDIRLWDVATLTLQHIFTGHSVGIPALAFSPNGQILASGSNDATVQLWTIPKDASQQKVKSRKPSWKRIILSPNKQVVASSSSEKKAVQLWDATTGAPLQMLRVRHKTISSISFSYDSQLIAGGSLDEEVYLWDVKTGALKQILEGLGKPVCALAFSPDNTFLAFNLVGNTTKVWDLTRAKVCRALVGPRGNVGAISYSPDGQLIATVQFTATHVQLPGTLHHTQVWDANTGVLLQTLHEPDRDGLIGSVAISSNNQAVASASDDGTINLWDTATGSLRQTVRLQCEIENLAFETTSSTRLLTEIGIIDMLPGPPACSETTGENGVPTVTVCEHGLSGDREWVVKENEKVLWIPPEYRPVSVVVGESLIFISCVSGDVIRYEAGKV